MSDIIHSKRETGEAQPAPILMVSGYICPEKHCALSIEVRRGMSIYSKEGFEVGTVAAVLLNGDEQKATHILLGRLPERSGYWLIPVDLIGQVQDGHLWLTIPDERVKSLPKWQAA